ncbi:HPP family protein [Streptomyces sp. NPDC017254]|uniref:HPP family protein n=1 Tax=unclassified Streptomyces TaxID=2593676 RepID=UPI00379A61B2
MTTTPAPDTTLPVTGTATVAPPGPAGTTPAAGTPAGTPVGNAPGAAPARRPGPPPRPRPRILLLSTAGSVAALLILVAVGTVLDQPLLIPPLAASMALVAGAPDLPLSQPRSVVGGQLLSALTGFAVLAAAGPGFWTAAVAGGLALGVMMLARTPHSPAAATAVIVALQSPPFWLFLGLLALACAVLVAVGLGAARATGRTYPTYWF